MISIQDLTVEFGSQKLFANVSFVINKYDKIALVGKNGAGKSTLMKIIVGMQQPTSGVVARPKDVSIGYLPQQMQFVDDNTVMQEALKAFADAKKFDDRISQLNAELVQRTDYDSSDYQHIISQLAQATEQAALAGHDSNEADAERTLLGLGFERSDFGRLTSEFSGGWRMRIELAKLLLRKPDVLLLDEPTNHLDIESIEWLEHFLTSRKCTLLLVSHDKAFLDNATNRTIEISLGKIYDYHVNYSKYVELRQERYEQQLRAYQNQQKEIKETKDFIERFRYKPTKAVQVQSRIKQLEKMEVLEVEELDNSHINLRFPPAPRSGDYPVIADGVGKSYGNHNVFHDVTFTIKRGEKVAFVGKNGAGKTTLVKCIMDEIPFDGTLKIGHNVKIGYFAQNQAQLLDGSKTVFETIDDVATGDIRTKINDLLGSFMFGGEAAEKKVSVLSGGEKSRLAMIKLLLEPVNLLILDEPTNHLDMRTKDILKNALNNFDGTIIVVSHDRDFLNGLVSKVYEFGHGRVKEFLGGIYDFLQAKRMESLKELERNESDISAQHNNDDGDNAISLGRQDYLNRKNHERALRKAEKDVKELEKAIADLETQIAAIEQSLEQGNASDASIYAKHGELNKQLETKMHDWEVAVAKLEELKAQNT